MMVMGIQPKVIVAESDDISAGLMEDFWRKVKDGTIDGRSFRSYLANPRRFSAGLITLARAKKILGKKVIGSGDAPIRYTESTLRQAVRENGSGHDWRLVFCAGTTLRQQRETYGTDREKQPCHRKDVTWHLEASEDDWANQNPESGWYLIDFNGRWGGLTWDLQEAELVKIQKLGPYARINPHIFGEAVMAIYQANNGERIAEDWVHWSDVADSDGCFVWVGYLDVGGLRVAGRRRGHSYSSLRVCVVRKFDA